MALPSLSFVVGTLLLCYLATFIIFAILRVIKGISIQRLGFTSLRHISYSPIDGIRLDCRGFGWSGHRPSFSQPTIFSIVLEEVKLTIDLDKFYGAQNERSSMGQQAAPSVEQGATRDIHTFELKDAGKSETRRSDTSKLWDTLLKVKDVVKRLQNKIAWLKYFDVIATKTSLVVSGVGSIHLGSFAISVDTRIHAIDRSRLFVHSRPKTDEQTPAEWSISAQSLLFEPHGEESIEILDHCVVNIHGFLSRRVAGLRDAAIFVKAGRLNIPCDQLMRYLKTVRMRRSASLSSPKASEVEKGLNPQQDAFLADERKVQAVLVAKEFIASVLRGIREVSFAISLFGLSKQVDYVRPAGKPTYFSLSLKEFGLDLFRLDSAIPAQAMYFARKDVAHQALLSAISLSIGVDDGEDHPERLLYVPMTTATIKTTLPAKLLQFATADDLADRNTNILYANLAMTSPSLDFTPRHVPLMLALSQRPASPSSVRSQSQRFFSRFLPKANISLSIQEPIVRVALPTIEDIDPQSFDFDLLISSTSSFTLDVQASHSSEASAEYFVTSELRLNSHRLYYQTASKIRHDLLVNELIEVKTQVAATPDVQIVVSANFKTFSLFLVRAEITKGIRQILRQARTNVHVDKFVQTPSRSKPNTLRNVPTWLEHVSIDANDFNFELAGLDSRLSEQPRGFAVHLENWSTDYKRIRPDPNPVPQPKRRIGSRSLSQNDIPDAARPPSRKSVTTDTDTNGRRLAVRLRGLESFIIEGTSSWEQEPFISLPKAEITLTTNFDGNGPILHVMTLVKNTKLQYSLFRHYCVAVACVMLNRTFRAHRYSARDNATASSPEFRQPQRMPASGRPLEDFVVFDVKFHFVQVKAELPSDPKMMIHVLELEATRRRFLNPYVKAQMARLYAQAPSMKTAWTRVVSLKSPRMDFRELRRKHHGLESQPERSFDFVSDAIRIGIPHQLVVHNIFENFTNTVKTVAQMHHRFRTNTDDYILAKQPEGAKQVPRMTFRTHVLLFELEEGAFEWKLGVIFRAGLVEQKQRLAREEAYRLKCRSLDNAARPQRPNRFGSMSADPERHRSSSKKERRKGENEPDATFQRSSSERARAKGYNTSMRYDKGGNCGFSGTSSTSRADAWEKLQTYNAQSWKKRIDGAMHTQYGQVAELRSLIWGMDHLPADAYENETILQIPQRPALLGIIISDVNITIDKPSFPISQCPDFLHRLGKGLPKDTLFSLLIPLNAHFEMGECRASLRDYPLPLLHIPAIKPGQSPKLPSWSLRTDFVIAEEFRDNKSTRDFAITVVPGDKLEGTQRKGGFAIDVRRTVSPIKTYSDIKMEINSARDTRFTWGVSYQAAIQDMMQVIEGFTKPQVDPSERVGFWDKIRLTFHSRINVAWKGDGDVHLMLKGTRDPYVVTGYGAGFVMIWRNDVTWNIHQVDDPCKFITVDSGDYVLAIPDFKQYARQSPEMETGQASGSFSSSTLRDRAYLTKVIMKLSGQVRWQAGLVFERNIPGGGRSSNFEPHYGVTLKNATHVKSLKEEPAYDAYRGFRSDYMHLSIAIVAPRDRDWRKPEHPPASNYNSIHLTPRFFTHFFAWWSMFSGVMSLPVHQGTLYPGIEKSGKKFGRHIATIKYSLLFSPLFLSHVYKHKEAEEFASSEDEISATGLKMRLDSFMLDIHQRREEFKSEVRGASKMVTTSGLRINQALLDLLSADIRALSANFSGTSYEAVHEASASRLAEFEQASTKPVDVSAFTIPDHDLSWIDIDDLVEIDWTLPADADPQTRILPLAYAPRFTYRRNTDHEDTISGEQNRHSKFGYESTHDCHIVTGRDPYNVEMDLVRRRAERIEEFIAEHRRRIGEQELLTVRETDNKTQLQSQLDELRKHNGILAAKKAFLSHLVDDLEEMREKREDYVDTAKPSNTRSNLKPSRTQESFTGQKISDLIKSSAQSDDVADFNNRFVIHNAHIKWTNALRNIMLRYLHQVTQRRGFVYYQSRRAVKFILDIVEEQRAKHEAATPSGESQSGTGVDSPLSEVDETEVQDRIQQLLNDGKRFVDADDPETGDDRQTHSAAKEADQHVAHGYLVQNTYDVRLVAPQIQFQSQKNTRSAVLLTARGIRLKVLQIMDADRLSDEISGLVQRRFTSNMENTQFFVTHKQSFSADFQHMYSHFKYGASLTTSWPPWVPLEVVFDFDIGSFASYGFSRVVQKTSASLRYDKYNQLRLKYNDNVSDDEAGRHRKTSPLDSAMDHLWVNFPQIRAICDSTQYYAIYTIIVDLLMYSDPLEKTRNEKLEKIMLGSDFSDLRGAPEMVVSLQERIRQLGEIKTHFYINERFLDRKGWQDRIALEKDLARCEEELFFMMKAVTSSQRRMNDSAGASQVTGMLRYDLSSTEIVWHLTRDTNLPLAEFQLRNAKFERVDNSDGSNVNSVEIDKIKGLNLLQHAIYPDILVAYKAKGAHDDAKMLRVNWHMLDAIAGIPVVDTFEVNLHPLQIQLEYETGRRLFEYIFPSRGSGDDGQSPFMVRHLPDENDDDGEDMNVHSRRPSLNPSLSNNSLGNATGAGSLDNRLTPTHFLPDNKHSPVKQSSSATNLTKSGLGIKMGDYDLRKLFHGREAQSKDPRPTSSPQPRTKPSNESLKAATARRRQSVRSPSINEGATGAGGATDSVPTSDRRPRFTLGTKGRRSSSASSRAARTTSKDRAKRSDDLSQMLTRASNYMTLAYVKLPSVVLCLSYKGKGNRNFEDIHNLVFTMPTVEYRNKTWSNLDLALAFKRDVVRALISHTGTIISNKFSHHRPGKTQQSKYRDMASRSAVLSSSQSDLAHFDGNITGSLHGNHIGGRLSVDTDSFTPSPRISDVTESDILDDRPSFTSYSRSTRDAPPSSYASSLAPTPESPEYEHRDNEYDGDENMGQLPHAGYTMPTPAIHVQASSQDLSHVNGNGGDQRDDSMMDTIRGSRRALTRHFSEFTARAANFRKSDGADNGPTPLGSRRNSFVENGEKFSDEAVQEGTEDRDEDGKSVGGNSGLTPKRAFKKMLKRGTGT